MKQHIVHDATTAEYASGLDAVWAEWEPALRDIERRLHGSIGRDFADTDEVAEALRHAQYRAHTASEFVAGLQPPLPAADAHEMLVTSFANCRDTLGAMAVRCELEELDREITEIGLGSIASTRDAFRSARMSTTAAWRFREGMEPIYVREMPHADRGGRVLSVVMWTLVAACAALFTLLVFEVFLLTPS